MFEDHSGRLRAALQSAARVRQVCMRVFDALEGSKDGVLSLGENHYSAEIAAANRSLQATLNDTRAVLALERKARECLEAKLRKQEQE